MIWAQANSSAGYRYSVETRPGSQSMQGTMATIAVVWTNYGSAAATENWVPGYKLVDFSGAVVRALPATVKLKMLVHDEPKRSASREVADPGVVNRVGSYRPHGLGAGALHAARLRGMATAQAGRLPRGELRAHVVGPRRP